jgi:predicted CXXCH cytochrome family protein
MKKSLIASLAMGMSLFGIIGVASAGTAPGTGIVDTAHDLSGASAYYAAFALHPGNDVEVAGEDRICVYCHAPHNTLRPGALEYMPLWNRALSTLTYAMYTAGTALPNETDDLGRPANHSSQSTIALAGVTEPGHVSKLCLSCHDGSVAINTFANFPDSSGQPADDGTGPVLLAGRTGIGEAGDLTNHHPVGFNWFTTVEGAGAILGIDDEIAPSTTVMVGDKTIADLLYGGNMECVTCHDVHNTQNTGIKFVWLDDTRSAFCLKCHLK